MTRRIRERSSRSWWLGGAIAVVAIAAGGWITATSQRPLLLEPSRARERETSAVATEFPAAVDAEPDSWVEPALAPERREEPVPAQAAEDAAVDAKRARAAELRRHHAVQNSYRLFEGSFQLAANGTINVGQVALLPAEEAALDRIVDDCRARVVDLLVAQSERIDELLKQKVAEGDSREAGTATLRAGERLPLVLSMTSDDDGKAVKFAICSGDDPALDAVIEKRSALHAELHARAKAYFDELPARAAADGSRR